MITAMERIGLIVLAGLLTAAVPSAFAQPQQKPAQPTSEPAEGLDSFGICPFQRQGASK